jgi:hypothetical protein
MVRWQLLLALFFPGLLAVALFHNPTELLAAVTALAVVVLLVTSPVAPQSAPAWVRSLSLRDRSHRNAYLRLRDPDAAGRPRPRAPGRSSAVAA